MLNQKFIRRVVFFILLCFFTTTLACLPLGLLFPAETRAPETFPEADIVFVSNKGLGFVNADGSNLTYVPLTVKGIRGKKSQWWRPVITGDSRTVIVKVAHEHFHVYLSGFLSVWRSGELPVLCQQWGPQKMAYLSEDQQYISTFTDEGIALYSLDDCGVEDSQPVLTHEGIIFGILSPNLKYSTYLSSQGDVSGYDRFIILHDMDSGEERTVGVGAQPAWSRDSQWLAYTGKDGIYIANILEETEPQRVILYTNPFRQNVPTYYGAAYWTIPPEASWSPDGKWLVYHRWTGTDYYTGTNPDYNAIYILNLETGEETKILDGGMYPYWRWPAIEE
jgi:hypothetical protein